MKGIPTNDIVRDYAAPRRYPTRRLEDGELVILSGRHRRRRGWWALEPHADGLLWAFYIEVGQAPGRLLQHLPAGLDFEDRSSDTEVYIRVAVPSGEALMATGPRWCRVAPRQILTAEQAAERTARLGLARDSLRSGPVCPDSASEGSREAGETNAGLQDPAEAPAVRIPGGLQ